MKFVSFNINGLRARPHQLEAIVEQHQPDVIGLQETKVHDDMFPLEEVAKLGYNVFYHGQKGHYGVALLTKDTPVSVRRGFPGDGEEAQRPHHHGGNSFRTRQCDRHQRLFPAG
ncbi:exodeoxyribonuclease III family protein [Enterobacter hormaechei]|nr:exodeoxyribonuclease III family protein [Enterobacter hormaechei]